MNELQEQLSGFFCFFFLQSAVFEKVLSVLSNTVCTNATINSRRMKFSCFYISSTQVFVGLWLAGLHGGADGFGALTGPAAVEL